MTTIFSTSKRGRPRRKNVPRKSDGTINYGEMRQNNIWQRIKQYGKRLGVDPRLESEIGRLAFFGFITGSDFEAANRFAVTVGRWEVVMGMPRRSTASPSYLMGRAGIDHSEPDPDVVSEARDSYDRMMALIPLVARNMLESVCVDNEMCPEVHYRDLHLLLERLAVLWGFKA